MSSLYLAVMPVRLRNASSVGWCLPLSSTSMYSVQLEKLITFSNWTEYMDVDDSGKHHPTLDAFRKRTGITAKYNEDINDKDRKSVVEGNDSDVHQHSKLMNSK